MSDSMINTITARVNEMKNNKEIQKIMNGFSSEQESQDWLIKAAMATLFGV